MKATGLLIDRHASGASGATTVASQWMNAIDVGGCEGDAHLLSSDGFEAGCDNGARRATSTSRLHSSLIL
jgi:hypothetical protein